MFFNSFGNPLNVIKFVNGNNGEAIVTLFDTFQNLYRRRFLEIIFRINIKLNINVKENLELPKLEKKEIKDLKEMKILNA